jgi:hypothetical protein
MAGGYQAPTKPAPASGPGKFSRRTDGIAKAQTVADIPDAAYGEQGEMREIQSAAPMSGGMDFGANMPKVTLLSEMSQRPDEPLTSGMALGPGPGLESLGIPKKSADLSARDMTAMGPYLPALEAAANRPGVPPSFVRFVRYVRSFS